MAKSRKKSSRKNTRKRKLTKDPFWVDLKSFFKKEGVKNFLGLALIGLSVLMLVSFISFLGTWSEDQNELNNGVFSYLFNTEIEVQNFAGKLGLVLSQIFIYNFFGIASFLFTALFFLYGLKLLKIKLLNLKRFSKRVFFLIITASLTLAFIFGDSYQLAGGGFGYIVINWLVSVVGNVGTVLAILLLIIGFLSLAVNNFWTKSKVLAGNIAKSKTVSGLSANIGMGAKETPRKTKENKKNKVTEMTEEIGTHVEEIKKTEDKPREADKKKTTQKDSYVIHPDGTKSPDGVGFEVTPSTNEDDEDEEQNTDNNQNEQKHEEENKSTPQVKKHDFYKPLDLAVEKNTEILYESINQNQLENYDPRLDLSTYKSPPLEFLDKHQSGAPNVSNEELLENKNRIVETLRNYKIDITKIKATTGPTITLYEIVPAPGVRISKIKNLEDDIALSLAALGIRIIAPMPGRGTVGIEVPNQNPQIVSMYSMIRSKKFQDSKMELPIALGKTISNEAYVFDLTKMPHLLVAGATGQGKSVGLNVMITSLLYKKHPSELKFVLVDPKKVELTVYERLEKHFLAALPDSQEPIINDNDKVKDTVNSLVKEMSDRYKLLKKAKVRKITEYNERFVNRKLNPNNGHKYLPYIVLIIDEFADLIMTAGKEIEVPIARLAQLARAVGIHMIVATQRPSTNIITGRIKANFPTRIAFKVASMIDSRTIIDSPGANRLVGRGDMLITEGSENLRLQCAFIDTPELDKLTTFIGEQQGYPMPFLLPEPEGEDSDEPGAVDLSSRDSLFEEAARLIVINQQGSTSLVQRKLAIGYNRAGRIMDQMEAAGIVGASNGSKPRDVMIADELSLEHIFDSLP